MVLEKFQSQFGYANSSKMAHIPENYKKSNIDRNLAEEMTEAVKLGLWNMSINDRYVLYMKSGIVYTRIGLISFFFALRSCFVINLIKKCDSV